ncbi:MAG TPA: Rrf2 family transcriptional regulator [Chthoniobacteraceae bacterium]|nr:Rrf2 family transcriptional regulator [Chthoniobacteraceae bacterium]
MRVSRKTEYALRALVAMARKPGRSYQIHELSENENIPVKYLEQILLTLKNAGFLASKRGVGGGYALRVGPAEIKVGEIVEIMDGPIAPVPCAALRPLEKCSCPDPRTCAVRLLMIELREQITESLGTRTIDDMLRLSPDSGSLAFEI